jgi:hypothetical protein
VRGRGERVKVGLGNDFLMSLLLIFFLLWGEARRCAAVDSFNLFFFFFPSSSSTCCGSKERTTPDRRHPIGRVKPFSVCLFFSPRLFQTHSPPKNKNMTSPFAQRASPSLETNQLSSSSPINTEKSKKTIFQFNRFFKKVKI